MSSPGPKGQPQFVGGDTVTLAAYLSSLGTYAALVGNSIVGTSSDRAAFGNTYGFSPSLGLTFIETDTDNTYRYKSSGWAGTRSQSGNTVMDGAPSAGNNGYAYSKNIAFVPGRFTTPPVVTFGVYTGATQKQHVGAVNVTASGFTLYYWRENVTTTTVGWTATPLD